MPLYQLFFTAITWLLVVVNTIPAKSRAGPRISKNHKPKPRARCRSPTLLRAAQPLKGPVPA